MNDIHSYYSVSAFNKSNRRAILTLVVVLMLLVSQRAISGICSAVSGIDDRRNESGAVYEIAFGKGLLWKIEKPNVKASYIFGTIHLENPEIVALPDVVKIALVKARSLGIEVVLDTKANVTYIQKAQQPTGSLLRNQTSTALFNRLVKIAERDYAMSESEIDHLKPWAAFTLLSRPRPITGIVMDGFLEAEATRLDKPVFGLETVDELVATLDSLTTQQQITILQDTVCQHDTMDEQIRQLASLYQNRDLAGMVALNEGEHTDEAVFDAFMQRILYQRNQRMVERMQPQLMMGGAFIAIGALHLPADRGVLRLLELQGYKISLVY